VRKRVLSRPRAKNRREVNKPWFSAIRSPWYIPVAMEDSDIVFMREALAEAQRAAENGEVPVGAVVVRGQEIVGRGANRMIAAHDPSAHAEIVAMREASQRLSNYRLPECTLYATVEPCPMCAGAAVLARLKRLVYGCDDPKAGAVRTLFRLADDLRLNHRVEIQRGVLAEDCAACLKEFFQKKRMA
jgi:tRNA(adenine34) deaminase